MGKARHTDGMHKISYPGGKCYLYRLILCDKAGTPFKTTEPEKFLSARSLLRRHKQRLPIDSTDLPLSPLYLSRIAEKGVSIIGKSKWNNSVLIKTSRKDAIKSLLELSFVKKAVLVFSSPDSIDKPVRSAFHREFNRWDTISQGAYGITEEQIKSLNGIRLHQAGFLGKGKLIAVLDGGFMNVDKIPSLRNIKMADISDIISRNAKGIFSEIDHGTKVLSVMAVNVPNTYIGTAPEASYALIRCEDRQTESLSEEDYWAEAAEYADSIGADIINSSLGYHDFDDATTNYQYADLDGEKTMISHTASLLANKGIVLVNSAGNDGMGTWKKVNAPGDAHNALTVGAISQNHLNAPFSSVGPTADGRIKPDVMAYGSPVAVLSGRGTIVNEMGTSFSAPLISGMIACLWQALPHKTAKEIIDLVRKSSDRYTTPDNVFGYGIPDFWKAYNGGNK